jgi:hypothetical protein
VNPLAGVSPTAGRFFITAFRASGVSDDVASGPATRNRTILLTGYKNPGHFLIAGERLWTTDATTTLVGRWPSLAARPDELAQGEGFTAFTTLSPAAFGVTGAFARLDLLGRIDNIDPDDKISDNDQRRLIAGAAYHFHPQLRLLLTHESVRYGSGALKPNEARFLLQSEIRF